MSIKLIHGDLIALAKLGEFDVIAHGCNCLGGAKNMGKGIAASIKEAFPEVQAADLATPPRDRNKLGSCSIAECYSDKGEDLIILNAYTQYHWKEEIPGEILVDYAAVKACMSWIKQTYTGKRIGLPLIGADLAGGDWKIIERIILDVLDGEDVTIVHFQPR